MAYEVVMPYHLHMPSYFLETFTEYPYVNSKTPTSLYDNRIQCLSEEAALICRNNNCYLFFHRNHPSTTFFFITSR